MEFDPELWLRIKNKKVSAHQMQILAELAKTHSQTQAAHRLGISVPVLHRHIKSLVNKLGVDLILTTPNGTWLTPEGRTILKIYHRYQDMLHPEQSIILSCSPITQELLLETVPEFEAEGKKYSISINSDDLNLKSLYLGRADLVIFDDPNYAIEFEGSPEDKILIVDIFQDTLLHVRNGLKYIKYKYGAQRLGYRYLDSEQIKYQILYEVSSLNHLVSSGKSYFLNQSLALKSGLELKYSNDQDMFVHPIMAVSINPTDELRIIVDALRATAKNFPTLGC
jgi:DNA-binding MarR family transcriptional regulator